MKSGMFIVGLLVFSTVINSQAWSAPSQESAEECYRIMERFVNGSRIETKDRFFRFQDHSYMKDLGGITDKTKPPTQYRNFLRSLANGQEQVTLQIFDSKQLPDQSKLPIQERVVKRFEVTHFQYANCTDAKNPKCFHIKKTFEMLDPESKTCFKTITESNNLPNSERTLLSSKFCKKWEDFPKGKTDSEKTIGKEFIKQNPKWQGDFEHTQALPSLGTLIQAVRNCEYGTASKKASWEADVLPATMINPVLSKPTSGGAK